MANQIKKRKDFKTLAFEIILKKNPSHYNLKVISLSL